MTGCRRNGATVGSTRQWMSAISSLRVTATINPTAPCLIQMFYAHTQTKNIVLTDIFPANLASWLPPWFSISSYPYPKHPCVKMVNVIMIIVFKMTSHCAGTERMKESETIMREAMELWWYTNLCTVSTDHMLFLLPNEQCKCIEANNYNKIHIHNKTAHRMHKERNGVSKQFSQYWLM